MAPSVTVFGVTWMDAVLPSWEVISTAAAVVMAAPVVTTEVSIASVTAAFLSSPVKAISKVKGISTATFLGVVWEFELSLIVISAQSLVTRQFAD